MRREAPCLRQTSLQRTVYTLFFLTFFFSLARDAVKGVTQEGKKKDLLQSRGDVLKIRTAKPNTQTEKKMTGAVNFEDLQMPKKRSLKVR